MIGSFPSSTHPPLPHPTEEHSFDCLRLLRSRRVGPATYRRLIREHGSAKAALRALPEIAQAAGVSDYTVCPEGAVTAELQAARAKGARLLVLGTPEYPASLTELGDAPPLLWVIGETNLLSKPIIAVVGARNASSLGTRMAKRLALDLVDAGYIVVSGLARGIDTAAHYAASPAATIAVMAGGADVVYPRENQTLYEGISASGLILSEMPMGATPQARHFPARNRIVSGLARAVVVIEAAAKSGSLITARTALDQGREVLAVPGHPFDARSAGCNILIRDGAQLVREVDDILSALPQLVHTAAPELPPAPQPEAQGIDLHKVADLHGQILDRLGPSPVAEDQLMRDLRVPAATANPALVALELDGKITRQAGGLLSRN